MLLASALTETLTLTVLFVSCSPCLSYLEVEVRLRVPAVQLLLGNQIVQRTLLHYHTLSALIPKQMQDSYAGKHSDLQPIYTTKWKWFYLLPCYYNEKNKKKKKESFMLSVVKYLLVILILQRANSKFLQ